MKKYRILLLLIFMVKMTNAQVDLEMFQIRQKPNTEQILADYLQRYVTDADYAYVTLFTPQMCPRCEVDINYTYKFINKLDSTAAVGLWISYANKDVASDYLEDKQFGADFAIFDTAHDWTDFFSLSYMPLKVTFLLKINLKTGRLVKGGEIFSVSEEAYRELIAWQTPDDFHDYNNYTKGQQEIKPFEGLSTVSIPLKGRSISVARTPCYTNGKLSFYDELKQEIPFFQAKDDTMRYHQLLDLSTQEAYELMEKPAVDYKAFEQGIKDNIFFLMANQSVINDKGILYGSYSLPNLTKGDSGVIAYRNFPTFITLDVQNSKKTVTNLDFGLDIATRKLPVYAHEHAIFSVLPDGNVAIRCTKGYPNYGGFEYWTGDAKDYDPRTADFYNEAYYFHSFDINTGNPVGFIGKLEAVFKAYQVGLAFSIPKLDYFQETIVYTSGTSGIVNVADFSSPNKITHQIKVFDIVDYKSEYDACTMEYLSDLYENVFNQVVIDVKIDRKYCYVISKENDGYYFKKFKYNGKLVTTVLITNRTKMDDIDCAIGNFDGEYLPFYIRKTTGNAAELIRLADCF